MEKLKTPISKFFDKGLKRAKKDGYKWVVCLVARNSDLEGEIYEQLLREWDSLDSVTGKDFLFVIACNEKIDSVANNRDKYDFADNQRFKENIASNQTEAINFLKEKFDLKESEIPCLVIISLYTHKHYKIPISGTRFYEYFKKLKSEFEESALDLKMLERDLEHLNNAMILNRVFETIEKIHIKGKIPQKNGGEIKVTNEFFPFKNCTLNVSGDIIQSIESLSPNVANNDNQEQIAYILETLKEIKLDLENGNRAKSASKLEKLRKLLQAMPDCLSIAKIIIELMK